MDPLPSESYDAVATAVLDHQHYLNGGDEAVLIIVFMSLVAFLIALVLCVVLPVRAHIKNTREREETKREIAAYAAEGSITPDEAARMIKAAQKPVFDWMGRKVN